MDLAARADIDAARRLVEDQHLRRRRAASGRSPPSAGCRRESRPTGWSGACALIASVADRRPRPGWRACAQLMNGSMAPASDQRSRLARLTVEGDALGEQQALGAPLLRNEAEAGAHRRRRRARRVTACRRASWCRHPAGRRRRSGAPARCGRRRPGRQGRAPRRDAGRSSTSSDPAAAAASPRTDSTISPRTPSRRACGSCSDRAADDRLDQAAAGQRRAGRARRPSGRRGTRSRGRRGRGSRRAGARRRAPRRPTPTGRG